MKTKLPLMLALVTALSPAISQDTPPPPTPPKPPEVERPPGPPHERGPRPESDRRHDRGPENRGPDGRGPDKDRDRGPDHHRMDDRSRFDGPRKDGPWNREIPQKPTPYLGVMTTPVPPPLAAQLGLSEGFGLVVDQVLPESPASTAGVQRYDVLKLINDQQLVDANQLATLVRSYGKDAQVTLTVLRKSQETKLSVKVGEKLLPQRHSFTPPADILRRLEPLREKMDKHTKELRERTDNLNKDLREKMRDFQEKYEKWRKDPASTTAPEPPKPETFEANVEPPPQPLDLLREVRPGGAPQIQIVGDDRVTTWKTGGARFFIKDDAGEIEVRTEDGKRMVTARDAQGETTFTGPMDSDADRQALPPAIREKLAKVEARMLRPEEPGVSKIALEPLPIVAPLPLAPEVQ